VPYTPHYPGGYEDHPDTDTLVTAASLNHTDQGVVTAQAAAEAAQADVDALTTVVTGVEEDVAALGEVARTNDYSDLDGLPTIPDEPQEVGALPNNVRIWTGAVWTARPSVPAGWTVEGYSDGTYGSARDNEAPSPTGAELWDAWTRIF